MFTVIHPLNYFEGYHRILPASVPLNLSKAIFLEIRLFFQFFFQFFFSLLQFPIWRYVFAPINSSLLDFVGVLSRFLKVVPGISTRVFHVVSAGSFQIVSKVPSEISLNGFAG